MLFSLDVPRQHLDAILTINIVLGPSFCSFVVVDHLHHQQEVVFGHLLHILGQFFHINLHPRSSVSFISVETYEC